MKIKIPKNYWTGKGRQIIVIPPQVLSKQRRSHLFLDHLYITEIGYYPDALSHYTHRKKGSRGNILIYCIAGEGFVSIGKEKHLVKANSFFLLPCNVEHEYEASATAPWSVYWIKYSGSAVDDMNSMEAAKAIFKPVGFIHKTEAVKLFKEIFNTLELGYSHQYLIYVNMLLVNFLTLFLFQHGIGQQNKIASPHEVVIQKAIAFMQQNINLEIGLKELAVVAGCSGSQLSKLFKENTGYSPINYFNHLKIQKACQYLYATNGLVKEVAGWLGYDDPYYFSRLFTKLMGISPNQYRLNNRQNS